MPVAVFYACERLPIKTFVARQCTVFMPCGFSTTLMHWSF